MPSCFISLILFKMQVYDFAAFIPLKINRMRAAAYCNIVSEFFSVIAFKMQLCFSVSKRRKSYAVAVGRNFYIYQIFAVLLTSSV